MNGWQITNENHISTRIYRATFDCLFIKKLKYIQLKFTGICNEYYTIVEEKCEYWLLEPFSMCTFVGLSKPKFSKSSSKP